MGNRLKEDDRIEKTIQGLLKLPQNRKCINCNNLGPQYVCTTFSTFVCTNCSGVHREFTHRVKSISMAKFTAEEVSALQAGGNERAKQIYFKDWDSHRCSFPDGSNIHRLRDFIKHVYLDRKYTGERSTGLPRLRLSDKHASSESRKVNNCGAEYRSCHDEDKFQRTYTEKSNHLGKSDDRNIKYYYDERQSPQYSRENSRHGGYRKSPVRFEVVDDRFRDEGFGNRRLSTGDSKLPNRKGTMHGSCSPVARPMREILGENVPTLQVGEKMKESNGNHADGSAKIQESNPVEKENGNLQSLIDFSTELENPDTAAMSQTQQASPLNTSSSSPSFQTSVKENPSEAPSANTLESLLFALSVPSAEDVTLQTPDNDILSTNIPNHSSNDDLPQAASSSGTVVQVTDNWPFESMLQHRPSSLLTAGSDSFSQQAMISNEGPKNESSFSSFPNNAQRSLLVSAEQSSEALPRAVQDANNVGENQLVETSSRIRKELPEDLFTASYSVMATPVSAWQIRPPHEMGFNYFHNTMPAQAKSTNPFDISDEGSQLKTPQLTANASMMPPQSHSIDSTLSPCTFTGQQVRNNIQFARPQGIGSFGVEGTLVGSINITQQPNVIYPTTDNTPQSSLIGRNPFG
ncbi:probable ADP-ribosylation factor GTPase-activating protein AGD14 isoform X2 [Humulus lupulus]|uniref:probable ADP-ribosylation factor GTPase-activating protein AGD14 isoform X2 n=1 Tax=Humulus lupulus TaxID=3486 RepID=UPI002B40F117|nr:probable ADP-ribosylation factor GTPase-activating protein AGD14 isoform X2 [Humulus lupulus]